MANPTVSGTTKEYRFDTSNYSDDDSTSIITLAEESLQVPRLPTGLMIALTCGIGGLQLIWSTIFSHGSAYLFSLGITESQSSLIWAIAPICGATVQPIVGAIADNHRSRWGRRRPFILGGAIGVVLSLTALAWVSDITRVLAAVFGLDSHKSIKTVRQIGTIACITLLNLSVQLLQSGLRALIVDVCPSEQQSLASAWAGRFTATSNVLGYTLGSLPFGSISHDNEAWRFRFLSFVSAAVLVSTVLITTYWIHEEDSRESAYESRGRTLFLDIFRNVKEAWSSMTMQARRTCFVQFFAWMGWFGFLFYSTSYVGRLYLTESRRRGVEHFELLGDAGIRLGTFASLLSAVLALATTVIAPYIAATKPIYPLSREPMPKRLRSRVGFGSWQQTHRIWAMSLLLYALCTFSTMFISSTHVAIFVVALTGVSWGVTQWAPFALLGEEVAMHQAARDSAIEKGDRRWATNQSGAIMGVHNTAISVPQIIAALGSSFVFRLFEGNGSGEEHGIAFVLRASGVAALLAAYFAWRLKP